MKKLIFLFMLISGIAHGQTTGYFRYDSIRFEKVGGNAEFILLNATRGVTGGVLTNIGNGRTAFTNISAGLSKFRRSLEVASDSLQLVNDEENPTDTSYYGKLGTKGWKPGAIVDVSDNAVGGITYWMGGRLFRIGDGLSWSGSGLNNKYRYLINGTQVLWVPDQTNFSHTMIFGNGGGSLTHSSGIQGQYNTALGYNTMTGITTGVGNVALGSRNMQGLTTGTNNTSVGEGSQQSLSTGVHNTSVGSQALSSVGGGGYNVAVGSISQPAGSGFYNVSAGYTSMNDLLNGGLNTGIGYQSLFYNRTGSRNTAYGFASLKGATTQSFSNSAAFGDSAGAANNSDNNTYIGSRAGWDHTTGAGSLFLGNDIQSPAPTEAGVGVIKNSIFLRGATGTGTTPAGKVGILVPNPLEALEVGGRLKINTVDDAVIDSIVGIQDGRLVKQAASTFVGGGGSAPAVVAVSTSTTLTAPAANYDFIEVSTTSGAVTLTLPAMTAGKSFVITKTTADANALSFTTAEGVQTITTQYSGAEIYYNGTNYKIRSIK